MLPKFTKVELDLQRARADPELPSTVISQDFGKTICEHFLAWVIPPRFHGDANRLVDTGEFDNDAVLDFPFQNFVGLLYVADEVPRMAFVYVHEDGVLLLSREGLAVDRLGECWYAVQRVSQSSDSRHNTCHSVNAGNLVVRRETGIQAVEVAKVIFAHQDVHEVG